MGLCWPQTSQDDTLLTHCLLFMPVPMRSSHFACCDAVEQKKHYEAGEGVITPGADKLADLAAPIEPIGNCHWKALAGVASKPYQTWVGTVSGIW